MKYSFYWKITNGNKTFFVVENMSMRWSQALKKAVKNLPFKGVINISKLMNSNFHKFVLDLYGAGHTIMEIDGKIHSSLKTEVADSIFNNEVTYIANVWRPKFDKCIIERNHKYRGPKIRMSTEVQKSLNKCLIYFAACDIYRQWVLEESRFYSLGLILDLILELEASLLLSANFYCKQAVQTLRNFLELVVAQYYFSLETSTYDDWRFKQDYKMPMFRGKSGMIRALKNKDKISPYEKTNLDGLYRKLSAYTHSKYEKLVHFDSKTKKCIPFDYNERYLLEWIGLAVQCMELGLLVLSKQTEDWERQLEGTKEFICPECHRNQFEVSAEKYGNKRLYLYSCKNCNNQLRIDKPVK